MLSIPLILLANIACLSETQSKLSAQVTDELGAPVPYASVEIRDEFAEVFISGEADVEGIIHIDLPPLQTFFAVVSADDYATASFTGFSGEGEFTAPPGTLWLRTPSEIESHINEFTNCTPDSNGLVDGQVRMAIPEQETEALPIVTTATVQLIDKNDTFLDACYIPSQGTDTETDEQTDEQTGETGNYAFFDMAEGLYVLRSQISIDGVETHQIDYIIYMPENGTVPLYPTLVPL